MGGTLPATGTFPPGSAVQPNTAPVAGASTALGAAQAGIPFNTLPVNVQQSIQSRLGNSQVQTISRDDLANGSIYRITTMQNGVPTEMRFAANGTFVGSSAISGTTTSAFTPGTSVVPGGGVVLDTLPAAVQSTVRGQVGTGQLSSIVPQGQGYVVTYDLNGRPTTLLVGPDGRILRAGTTATGAAPVGAVGAGASTNVAPQPPSTNNTRSSSIQLDELPDAVRTALQNELGAANVQFVSREQRAIGDVYLIGARTDRDYVQITFDENGRVIRDTRNTPIVAVGPVTRPNELDAGIPFNRVPVAVQNAVKAYATAAEVRSVNLGLDQGKTVYDVIYMRGGRRDRMIVGKDGSVVRTEQDVAPALETGRSEPKLAIGDLPPVVRDTIRQQTANVLVQDVSTRQLGDEVVYAIRYNHNGAPVELLVDSRGAMVLPETSPDAQTPNAPRPAPVPPEEAAVVRVVPAEKITEASGVAAATEVRTAVSDDQVDGEEAPVQQVTLNDVPLPVQNRAKQIAGSGVIESINPKLGDSGVVYEVTVSQEGERRVLRMNKDGVVQQD